MIAAVVENWPTALVLVAILLRDELRARSVLKTTKAVQAAVQDATVVVRSTDQPGHTRRATPTRRKTDQAKVEPDDDSTEGPKP